MMQSLHIAYVAVMLAVVPATLFASQDSVIRITPDGFVPTRVEITAGDTVVFVSDDDKPHWVASDVHPTHSAYPGSDIRLCDTKTERIFDACHGLSKGERYRFTFTRAGTWKFHDHLNPPLQGEVVVAAAANSPTALLERDQTALDVSGKVRAWLQRGWYVLNPAAGQTKLHELNLIHMSRNDATLE